MIKYAVAAILILSQSVSAQGSSILYGRITNGLTNQSIKDVNITVEKTSFGTSTDSLGNYNLILPEGFYSIKFSYVGFETAVKEVIIKKGKLKLNVILNPVVIQQPEVNISGLRSKDSPVKQQIKEKDLDKIPNLFSDVIRSVKILPGVTSNNELTSAYNVRGGNFTENLIYLNGYEIYRPFLIQQGIEESQSIINQDLTGSLVFYNGAFPALFGDKMSSALEVNYKKGEKGIVNGTARASLLNMGAASAGGYGKINYAAGFRFAYPSMFAKVLQTKGNYTPQFIDFQLLTTYFFNDKTNIELFLLTAQNKFNLVPETWRGHFQMNRADIREVSLEFGGSKVYKFNTSLAGLKFISELNDDLLLTSSAAVYSNEENINKNFVSNVFYSYDAYKPNNEREYLKTRYEYSDDRLKLNTIEFKSEIQYRYSINTLRAGIEYRNTIMKNKLDESSYEEGIDSVLYAPVHLYADQNLNFNSISGFIQDDILFNKDLKAAAGIRLTKYYFSDELLISPRGSISYNFSQANTLSFLWGYFYQPPYYYEVQGKSFEEYKNLVSQKSVHYVLNWQTNIKQNMKLTTDFYYKKLGRIIPYYVDDLKLTYAGENNSEGYAYGFDIQFEGELVKGMNTWIGYSYLNSKERNTGNNSGYKRRLLDQTHTIRIFLQDKMPKIPELQTHVNLTFGSGFLYYPRMTEYNGETNEYRIVVDYTRTREYPFYFRVDMGLTYNLKLGNKSILFSAEVYNVFNKYNIASYSWYHVLPETIHPVAVPNIFSKQFFNIGAEITF